MSSYHIINDPIHGVMSFDEEEKNLIKSYMDSSTFQRLRRIKQLGCGDLVFPGAVHTRFNHSLGACYLASIVCRHLSIPVKTENQIIIAALLHDIGHGPFSHAFEKMYKNISNEDPKCQISHDYDWTPKFINSFEESENGFNKKISEFFMKSGTSDYQDIISSQLDVDRLDYLLRDSHFCGVPYGSIDLRWIISCLKIVEVGSKKRLGIHKKGIGAIEHYIFSRRLMTKNVYYHGKKNAAEYLVREFLLGLEVHQDEILVRDTPLMFFMKKYFEYKNEIKGINNDERKDELKNNFIKEGFEFYKEITDDDIWICMRTLKDSVSKSGKIAKKLLMRELPKCYQLDAGRIDKAKEIINVYIDKLEDRWKIYVDNLNFEAYKSKKCPIFIDESTAGSDINYESGILNHLSDKSEVTDFLYIDKSITDSDSHSLLYKLNKAHCLCTPYESSNPDIEKL